MNAKEILETILKNEGITYNELSKKMGLKRAQALYDIRDGKIKHISHEAAEKIISAYPQYNKSWLLTGDGNVINNEPASEESAARNIEYTNNFKLAIVDSKGQQSAFISQPGTNVVWRIMMSASLGADKFDWLLPAVC